jgi:hypothetical protein
MKIEITPFSPGLLLCLIIECKKNESLIIRPARNTKKTAHNKGPSAIEKRSILHGPLISDGYPLKTHYQNAGCSLL